MPIATPTPADALARMRAGALLLDIRADHERALGMADGAGQVGHELRGFAPLSLITLPPGGEGAAFRQHHGGAFV